MICKLSESKKKGEEYVGEEQSGAPIRLGSEMRHEDEWALRTPVQRLRRRRKLWGEQGWDIKEIKSLNTTPSSLFLVCNMLCVEHIRRKRVGYSYIFTK